MDQGALCWLQKWLEQPFRFECHKFDLLFCGGCWQILRHYERTWIVSDISVWYCFVEGSPFLHQRVRKSFPHCLHFIQFLRVFHEAKDTPSAPSRHGMLRDSQQKHVQIHGQSHTLGLRIERRLHRAKLQVESSMRYPIAVPTSYWIHFFERWFALQKVEKTWARPCWQT